MPMALQAKIAPGTSERNLVRLGGGKTIDLDIRVIAATKGIADTGAAGGSGRTCTIGSVWCLSNSSPCGRASGGHSGTGQALPVSCIGVNTEKETELSQTPWQS